MTTDALAVAGITIREPVNKLVKKFGFTDPRYLHFGAFDGYQTPAERGGNRDALEY